MRGVRGVVGELQSPPLDYMARSILWLSWIGWIMDSLKRSKAANIKQLKLMGGMKREAIEDYTICLTIFNPI